MMLFMLAAAAVFMGVGFNIARTEPLRENWPLLLIFLIGVVLLLLAMAWTLFRTLYTEFRFLQEGLQIQYPLQKARLIGWQEFRQVCICYQDSGIFGYQTVHSSPAAVLCFVKNGVKRNSLGRWTTVRILPTDKIFVLEYSEQRHQALAEVYPGIIADLCDTEPYRSYRAKDGR